MRVTFAVLLSGICITNGVVPSRMRAIGLRASTGGVDLLEEFECETPVLRPRDLLVRVVAAALNPVDCKLRTNRGEPGPLAQPLILGFDGSGEVVARGEAAALFETGSRVFFAGSILRNGTNAEFVAVDERLVASVPASMSFTEAASLPLTGLTAMEGLTESMSFERTGRFNQHFDTIGKRLLVLPGAGGVGGMVVQLAKLLCHKLFVIATASRGESGAACQDLGADLVLNHSEPLGPQLEAAGLGASESVDYIFNGHDVTARFDEYVEILRPFGRVVEIVPVKKSLPMYKMQAKRLSYVWEYMFTRSMYDVEMEKQGITLDILADFVDQGKVRTSIGHVFAWSVESFRVAHQQQESGHTIGKIVVSREEGECKSPIN